MRRAHIPLIILLMLASPVGAQDREVPYWATIRGSATELNMRVGPSADYPVSWVYKRPGLPVRVLRVHESWRLVEDPSGTKGWVASRLLSPERGAIVTGGRPVPMRADASASAPLKWFVAPGVVGKLGDCVAGWCRFTVGQHDGWVERARLWGPDRG
jgi:SH3-like domain-containing protein